MGSFIAEFVFEGSATDTVPGSGKFLLWQEGDRLEVVQATGCPRALLSIDLADRVTFISVLDLVRAVIEMVGAAYPKIQIIRAVRLISGCGLKEALDTVTGALVEVDPLSEIKRIISLFDARRIHQAEAVTRMREVLKSC